MENEDQPVGNGWRTDFFDDFDTFDTNNWQDQRIWVNNETHCYVPDTRYVAGRIASKNRQEFVKGRWTARLRTASNGEASMLPAWWQLGAQNNESPVQEENENICWSLTGSGEIDILEHHGDHDADHFATGAIKNLGECDKGDWWTLRIDVENTLDEYHEYSVEWSGSDLPCTLENLQDEFSMIAGRLHHITAPTY